MIRLFHVSDVHFGAANPAALAWFAACVADERPDAVVFTGDLTMRATAAEFEAGQAWLEGLGGPVSLAIGNHDIPYYSDPIRRLTAPYARYEALKRAIERPLALPGVTIVPLQTVARAQLRLDQSQGRVSRAALAAALAAIAVAPPGVILVAAHHPLINPTAHGGRTSGGNAALAALARAGASAVLSGHVHEPFDLIGGKGEARLRMIGAGTLSTRIRQSPASFNELCIDDGAISVTARIASVGQGG